MMPNNFFKTGNRKRGISLKYAAATLLNRNAQFMRLFVALLGLLTISLTARSVPACDQAGFIAAMACPPLLMENECRAYIDRMASAATAEEREKLIAAYDQMVQEREQICPCTPGYEDWSRLRQPETRTHKTVSAGLG